jgi:hypothetical protein
MSVAARPTGTTAGLNVENFSTTTGRKSLAPKRGFKVSASVVLVVAIVAIALYLEA